MVTDITYNDARQMKNVTFIDVRSEGEYEESHIPGAVNVPLFNNEERAQVGTVYKQIGPDQAKDLGLQIASAKLPNLISAIQTESQGNPIVVYCWRGGMRSRSVSTVLDLMGASTYRLNGGYRGYREYVTSTIEDLNIASRCILIHGMTGTGKTDLLRLLAEDGEPVIDLEGMAGHKGSAFGAIGENPNNQRTFDSLLVDYLEIIESRPYFFMEAESQRIGRVRVPEPLFNKKFDAVHVLVEASVETRVQRLLEQYVIDETGLHTKLSDAYRTIESRLPTEIRKEIWVAFEHHRYADVAALLLVHYYDPLYARAGQQYSSPETVLSSEDLVSCKEQLKRIAREKTTDVVPDPDSPVTMPSQHSL